MRRARFETIAALALALGGCALFAPWHSGDDPRGRLLKARGAQVVLALERYRADNGKLPRHLFELLPKYMTQLPDGLKTEYDPDENRLQFSYAPPAPGNGVTTCEIAIGARDWDCHGTL